MKRFFPVLIALATLPPPCFAEDEKPSGFVPMAGAAATLATHLEVTKIKSLEKSIAITLERGPEVATQLSRQIKFAEAAESSNLEELVYKRAYVQESIRQAKAMHADRKLKMKFLSWKAARFAGALGTIASFAQWANAQPAVVTSNDVKIRGLKDLNPLESATSGDAR